MLQILKTPVKALLSTVGLKVNRVKSHSSPNIGKVGFLSHKGQKRGNVLISYIVEPFLLKPGEEISSAHHHDWMSWQMGRTFTSFGYDVDVIDYQDYRFNPGKEYDFFVGARTNFQRLAELLPSSCVKIVHLDTAHWLFNNAEDYRRHLELQRRRGVTLNSFKSVEPNWAIEYADYATINWGNQFNIGTYSYAGKPIFQIPLPTAAVYPSPEDKDYQTCRNHFLWFGSAGLVHKGLDLVLEAFSQMPEYRLTVCGPLRGRGAKAYKGPLSNEPRFEAAFHRELYESGHIHTAGWVDVESRQFSEIVNQCIGVIFPSCSEGCAGSVITCMQAGLIPIVSYQTNVEVGDFGYCLNECSIEEIKKNVRLVAALPPDELKKKAHRAWQFCRTHHTREKFAQNYRRAVEQIMTGQHHRPEDPVRTKSACFI